MNKELKSNNHNTYTKIYYPIDRECMTASNAFPARKNLLNPNTKVYKTVVGIRRLQILMIYF